MPTMLDTVATILFTYAAHSAAACLLALILARAVRRPQDRDPVWKAALIAPLFTTLFAAATLRSGAQLDVSAWVRRAALVELPGREVIIRIVRDASGEIVVRRGNDPVTLAIAVAAVTIATTCAGLALLRMIARHRRRAELLAHRQRAHPTGDIRISIVDGLPSPVALSRGEICLPAAVVSDFSHEHREALLAHERAHLARRDPAWFSAIDIIGALTAFQPLVWPVIRAFRRDVELICDETAVRQTRNPRALVEALAMLASPFDARSPLHGAALAHDGSPLVARAERIAGLARAEEDRGVRVPALILAAGLAVAVFAVPTIASSPRDGDLPAGPRRIVKKGPLLDHQIDEEHILHRVSRDERMTVVTRVIRL